MHGNRDKTVDIKHSRLLYEKFVKCIVKSFMNF